MNAPVSYFPSWHGNKRWGGNGECVLLLRASGWQFQTWIEMESKEIRFFIPALQHSLQRPFETRSMHSGALPSLRCSTILLEKIKWRKRLCHGLLHLLSVAEHHSHGYSNWICCQNTFAFCHSPILSSQITTGYTSGNYVTIKCGGKIVWQ